MPCDVTDHNFAAALVMYGSYLGLFVFFALEKYLFPSAKQSKEDKAVAAASTRSGSASEGKEGAATGAASKRSASASKSKGH